MTGKVEKKNALTSPFFPSFLSIRILIVKNFIFFLICLLMEKTKYKVENKKKYIENNRKPRAKLDLHFFSRQLHLLETSFINGLLAFLLGPMVTVGLIFI